MNTPKLSSLSPEQKNVLIAEVCGWNPERQSCGSIGCTQEYCQGKHYSSRPSYTTSLDAMHEAEKVLENWQWSDYTMALRRMIQRDCDKPECYVPGTERAQLIADFWFYHATAAQRQDAFLLATGKAEL